MTKSKFISDYAERYAFHILEGYTEDFAVEKMLGEVYDKVKRPTREEYEEFIGEVLTVAGRRTGVRGSLSYILMEITNIIYNKYLFDSNGGERTKS